MANLIPVNKSPISKKINSDSFFGKKAKIGKSDSVKAQTKGSSLKNEFILIRKKVIKIDKLLNAFIKFQKKNQEGTRREKELGKRSDRESKLEKKKDKVGAISFPSLPVGGNFLESIKRFLFFTFLNIALPKLLELLPKLRELGKAIAPTTKFLLDIAGGVGKGLLSGLVNFIDWGYKIRDNTEKTIKQIGGDKASKDFNEFNKRLNTFIDLSILAGLTALDVGLDAERFRKKQLKDQQKPKGRKPQVTEGRGGQKPIGRPKVTTGAGGKAGAGPVTQGRGGKPLGKFSKFKSGPFAKFAGPIGKFLGAATPFLGAGIGAADAAARFSSGDKVGGALASASSALDAFSGVAAITGFGLPLAGIATGISIGIDIVLLVRDLIKVMLPGVPMFRNGGRIRLFAQGGRIGTPGRTIKVQRKTLGARPSAKPEIKPGKDVGGKNQILKLFPDPSSENKQQTVSASPWWSKIFGSGQNASSSSKKAPNPYKALKGTAEILGKIPGDIGRLMSAGAAIPLGQKPDRDIGRGFGSFVGKITQDIIDNNVNLSFGDIIKSISGFANGGDIRNQNIMKNNDIGYQVGQVVEKAIGSMISSKVNEAVSSIQREISSIGKPPEDIISPITDSEFPEDQYDYNVTGGELPSKYPGRGPTTGHNYPAKDYAVDVGNAISVFVPGKVVRAGNYNPDGYGNEVIIQHENGLTSQYAHLSKINVREGDVISKNTIIGLTGGQPGARGAGRTTGPHLHFELRDYRGNKITQEKSGDSYFRFGRVLSATRRTESSLTNMKLTGNTRSGQASWYGPGFHGQNTASGEVYDQNKMTAAMYQPGWGVGSNPFYVEVTNTSNNKKVRVKVNDTGPFAMDSSGNAIRPLRSHPTRIIDLSKAAMSALGGLGSGVINVTVQKLGAAARTVQPKQQPPGQIPTPTTQAARRPSTAEQLKNVRVQTQAQKPQWTPPKDSIVFTIPNRGTYYANMKSNKVYDSSGMPVDVSGGKNRSILEGLQNKRQTNPELFRTSASLAPQKPKSVDVASNLSYQEGQSGFLAIQPINRTVIQTA